jgi:uncharacterized protein with HEPN domain
MRDTLIDRYFGVKLDLVWEVIEKDLPDFMTNIEAILSTLPQTPDPASG